jgi:hypothetical protein
MSLSPLDTIEALKKHGITGFLVITAFYFNSRMTTIEEKLAACQGELILTYKSMSSSVNTSKDIPYRDTQYAVIPNDPVGKIKWA